MVEGKSYKTRVIKGQKYKLKWIKKNLPGFRKCVWYAEISLQGTAKYFCLQVGCQPALGAKLCLYL